MTYEGQSPSRGHLSGQPNARTQTTNGLLHADNGAGLLYGVQSERPNFQSIKSGRVEGERNHSVSGDERARAIYAHFRQIEMDEDGCL